MGSSFPPLTTQRASNYGTLWLLVEPLLTVRYHIGRLYGCAAHWDSDWQNIEFHITAEGYESGTLKYRIQGDYGGAGSQANMLKLYLTEANGPMIPRFRLVLGTVTDAGWDHSGADTFYMDLLPKRRTTQLESNNHTDTRMRTNPSFRKYKYCLLRLANDHQH